MEVFNVNYVLMWMKVVFQKEYNMIEKAYHMVMWHGHVTMWYVYAYHIIYNHIL